VKAEEGKLHTVDLAGLRPEVLHEVAHQIFHEYKVHALDMKKEPHDMGACNWVEEGVAEFLPSFVPVDGNWTLRRVKSPRPDAAGASGSKHSGGGAGGNGGRSVSYEVMESGWEWCHDHANEIAPLAEFVTYDQPRMASARLYHVARVLADYLLEGKDRAYRSDFCRLIEVVHEVRADDRSFATCFPGVDVGALDGEFRAYCKAMKLDAN
jgi:hypothetical protein